MKIYAKYSTTGTRFCGNATNYEIDEINTVSMFCNLIADQKPHKYETENRIRQLNLIQVLGPEKRVE